MSQSGKLLPENIIFDNLTNNITKSASNLSSQPLYYFKDNELSSTLNDKAKVKFNYGNFVKNTILYNSDKQT